jgi:Fur family transcriptional regulator, ferric uptake regulator
MHLTGSCIWAYHRGVGEDATAVLTSPADIIDLVLARIRQRGGRATPARRLLLSALLGAADHRTAEDLTEAVRARAPEVHLTTIYRNLDDLERMGVVDRMYVSHGPAAYHLASVPHGHLACEECGAIADIPAEAFRSLAETAIAMHGFAISAGHFAVPGRCANCR